MAKRKKKKPPKPNPYASMHLPERVILLEETLQEGFGKVEFCGILPDESLGVLITHAFEQKMQIIAYLGRKICRMFPEFPNIHTHIVDRHYFKLILKK